MAENTSIQKLNQQQKEVLWLSRIEECRKSGMRVQDWCAEQGLSYHTYYKWQRRLFKAYTSEPKQFYEVSCVQSVGCVAMTLRTGEYTLDVYSGADYGTISAVIQAIKLC